MKVKESRRRSSTIMPPKALPGVVRAPQPEARAGGGQQPDEREVARQPALIRAPRERVHEHDEHARDREDQLRQEQPEVNVGRDRRGNLAEGNHRH